MTKEELAQALADKDALLDSKDALIAELQSRVASGDSSPMAGAEFPRIVYRAQVTPDPKQIDHPGFDAKRVDDPVAMDAALADGWTLRPE